MPHRVYRGVRSFCFCLLVIALCATRAAAQCSSVLPGSLQACNDVQGYLASFQTTLSTNWHGSKPPVAFGTELLSVNCNRGIQSLLTASTMAAAQAELDALAKVGVQSVTIAMSFPILYKPFYQYINDTADYDNILAFYQQVIAMVHQHGMKALVETSVMFTDNGNGLPLTEYYATLASQDLICWASRRNIRHKSMVP